MGIRDDIQSELAEAFNDDLADAINTFTCSKVTYSGKYNPVTEQYEGEQTVTYQGRGLLFGSYQKDLVKPSDYQADDAKATVLQNEVTAKPQINDVWVTSKGSFKIINIGTDPTDSIWKVQLRSV
ncbi:glutamate 5-kinase [Acinetobacter pollinis]|uniref:glutamate 5-kinase n=1 Tax=Acinetobacter pollinis TaxID=2605270 RepID=UPI0018C2ECA8|nr:glutamate 5-kinase [Acinetobacter pollinis]MBF7694027.1 glutamate 5-kinase [Acinetobacter pollinis]MBF7701656.1 glutamate 5-kinase [Acinetobacter pollinis]